MPPQIDVPKDFTAVVLTLGPRVDATTLPVYRGAADRSGVPAIKGNRIVHARQIEQLDSSAVASLFDLLGQVTRSGFELVICDPPPALERYLEVYHAHAAVKGRIVRADAAGRHSSPAVKFIPPFVPAPGGRIDIYKAGKGQSFSFGSHELKPIDPVDLAKADFAPPAWAVAAGAQAAAASEPVLPLPEFLRSLGKQDVKPGGVYATRKAVERLLLAPRDALLVIGPESAEQGFHLAMTARSSVTSLVSDANRALSSADTAMARRLATAVGTVLHLPFDDESFDAVLLEATLSYLDKDRQRQAIDEVARVLKPGGRLAMNELCWRQVPTPTVEAGLHEVWGGPVHPRMARGWWDLLEAACFEKIDAEQAIVSYFTRKGMEADEGEAAINIFHAAFEDAQRLARFSRAHLEFTEQRRYHGVIIASAVKS